MKFLLDLVSWGFPLIVACYLYFLYKFISAIKVEQKEYWESIGNPSSSDPNGQAKVLKLIFLPKALPASIFVAYEKKILAIRGLAYVGVIFFAAIIVLGLLGQYK